MPYYIDENCIGCTACAKLCPVFAIDGVRGERHTVKRQRCVSCGVCGRVCPKGAVLDDKLNTCTAVPRTQWRRPTIDTQRCSACSMCVSICTAGALRIAAPKFRGDIHVWAELFAPGKCVGCGLCERECPLGAVVLEERGAQG